MSHYKHILIDSPFDGPEYDRLMSLKDNPILSNSKDITLINVYNSKMAAHLPGDIDNKDLDQVEYVIKEKLEKLKEIIDSEEKLNWSVKVIFNPETKNAACYYAKEIGADLVIISTRGIEQSHLHNESFAQYMLEQCNADLLVLKPS